MTLSQGFQIERSGKTLILTPGQSMGSFSRDEMLRGRKAILDAIREEGADRVVVDFGKVTYFGSMLLDTMCVVWKELQDRSGRMSLCNVSDVAGEVLKSARLHTLWPVCETRDHALQSVGSAD